ncbi:MAG: hypothetical protein RML75_08035 [Cyanobacteriota bacterium SKYGB_h_bin112]|nr:hypothetical protein [Cyanobacteriota bacterium SKYGB_h_bin112]
MNCNWKIGLRIGAGCLSLLAATLVIAPCRSQAETIKATAIAALAMQRLGDKFSPDIQATLAACRDRGKVNLSLGPDQDGSVICGDQSRNSPVQYQAYVATLSDLLSGMGLAGIRSYMQANPQVSPRFVAAIARTPNGTRLVRDEVRKALADSAIVAGESPSVNLLTDQVLQRALPILRNPAALQSLYGTSSQYRQVVQTFCTPPGTSVEQLKSAIPQLNSVQLYAICVKESGLADEILGQLVK